MTWVEEVGGSEGGGGAAGVWFPPRSLPQPLLIPLAGSRISLSEPNTPPFTYSTAGAARGGGAQAAPAPRGPERHLGPRLSFLRELLDLLPSYFQKPRAPAPKYALPHKTCTPKTSLKHPAPSYKSECMGS